MTYLILIKIVKKSINFQNLYEIVNIRKYTTYILKFNLKYRILLL